MKHNDLNQLIKSLERIVRSAKAQASLRNAQSRQNLRCAHAQNRNVDRYSDQTLDALCISSNVQTDNTLILGRSYNNDMFSI